MGTLEIIRMALLDLSLHKFRSALATLGIIFGVASVLAMISISEGAKQEEIARYAALGVENITLRSVKPQVEEDPSGKATQPQTFSYGLLRRDLEHMREMRPATREAGHRWPRFRYPRQTAIHSSMPRPTGSATITPRTPQPASTYPSV